MKTDFDFQDLFVLDLANNHSGSVSHARRVIEEMGAVVRQNQVRAGLKFQFRHLETFVHPSHQQNSGNKHIPRFLGTKLNRNDFAELTETVRAEGMVTISTPFDEASVDLIVDLGMEVVKIASCSATDWPLLEKVADCNKPVIFSTGGLDFHQIDDLVSFFDHRRVHYAIMHCVSIYPTPDEHLQLNQVRLLKRRYRRKTIGFSTHEAPDDLVPVAVAIAKGARMLERHVGIPTEKTPLNAYSSTPEQVDRWIKAAVKARVICGDDDRPTATQQERDALDSLKRGVYAKHPLKPGTPLEREDVYFAMPLEPGQLSSGDWRGGIVTKIALGREAALIAAELEIPGPLEKQVLFDAIHTAKAMLNEAHIALPAEFETEFSHHYGMAEFPKVGIIMITIVNRSYCKKLVIQLPGQRHPMHYHKKKEETFQVLHGILGMRIEDRERTLYPGDVQLVQQGVWHEFWTDTGVIFEEISSTHQVNDSFYEDKMINQAGASRKTVVNQWGRYQI